MTDTRITSATATPTSLAPNGRMPPLLTGGAPDFSGLLQAFVQPLPEEAPPPALAEPPADHAPASTPEDEAEDQPTRRDSVKTARAATPLAPVAARTADAEDPADGLPAAELAPPSATDTLPAATKPDNVTENIAASAETAPQPDTANDTMLAWLAGQQAVVTPKIAASQKATPAPADTAVSAAVVAPTSGAAAIAPMPADVPTEATVQLESAPDQTFTTELKPQLALRAKLHQESVKTPDATTTAIATETPSISTVLPPQTKSAEPEAVRALAAQPVPESSGNAPTITPPQGIAPVSVTAPIPLPTTPKPVDAAARTAEQNFANLDALGGTRSLNGYQSATQLTATRTTRASGLQAAAVVEQVAVKLHQQAQSGLDQLTIQLRPADLGRIDVKLQFHDGSVTGTIIADSQATLDLLQKDQRSLERALQESGLRTDPGALSFALRDQAGQGQQQLASNGRGANRALTAEVTLADDLAADGEPAMITANRVNLRV